jgi:hypothetical protein
MHKAAGGTIQRLKPGFAIVRLRSRKPNTPSATGVCTVVVIVFLLMGFVVAGAFALYKLGVFLLACPLLGFGQTLDRSTGNGVQSFAACFQMREDLLAHSRIPEFIDVIRRPHGGSLSSLARKELAYLISHVNQLVKRHW